MATANDLEAIVTQLELDSDRMHIVVNGDATTTAFAEDGSELPSIRKTLVDNLQFKTPPVAWAAGTLVRAYNQLYIFDGKWWYSPVATNSNLVTQGASPVNDPNWRLFPNVGSDSSTYAPINSPLFTGNPQGPTPATGDDSKSLATTEFIQDVATELRAEISGAVGGAGSFTSLNVSGATTLNTLAVSGAISAPTSDATLHKITLQGSDGELTFANAGTPPVVGAPLTSVKPYGITTYDLNATKIETGVMSATDVTLEHLHITGNGADPAGTQDLIVDGNTTVNNLTVTGTVTGISSSVDGTAIAPSSVTSPTGTFENLTVHNTLEVDGTTNVNNLNVTGTVTGISANVDGTAIAPSSVTTTGNVGVAGQLNVNGSTNVGDLNITGIVTGLTLPPSNVDGLVIQPASIEMEGVLTATQAVLDDDGVTIVSPAVLDLAMPVNSVGIVNTGSISTDTLTATSAQIPSVTTQLILMSSISATITTATYKPVITANLQNLTLGASTVIQTMDIPAGGASFMFYFQQDATGSRTVTFDAGYVLLNSGVVNPAPNSVTLVQVIYRGTGSLFDVLISPRP